MKPEKKLSRAGWRKLRARQKEGIVIILICLIGCIVQCSGYGVFVTFGDGINIEFARPTNIFGATDNIAGGFGPMSAGNGGGAYEMVVKVSRDTFLSKQYPNDNYGTSQILVKSYINLYQARAILEFDITELPETASNISADMYLYFYSQGDGDPEGLVMWAYKLARDDWEEMEATWNVYKTGSNWGTAGGDYVTSDPVGGDMIMPCKTCYQWLTWEIDEIVNDAVENEKSVGVIVRYENENLSAVNTYLRSSDYADSDYWPKLIIRYDMPTPPGSPIYLNLQDLGANSVNATWEKNEGATYTLIKISRLDYPATVYDGELVYYGSDNTCVNTGLDLALTPYYYAAWGFDGYRYSVNSTMAKIGGDDIVVITIPDVLDVGINLPFAFYAFVFGVVLLFVAFFIKSPFLSMGVFFAMLAVVIEPTFQNTWFQYAAAAVIAWSTLATAKRFLDWRAD